MNEKQTEFEQRLNSLIILKALLIREGSFDEAAQKEYQAAWDRIFELLQ